MSTPTVDYDALAQQYGASAPASGQNVDYDALAKQYGAVSSQHPGEVTNDVGNTLIVPKDGESFLDTMRRAASQGGNTTQSQIDAEMRTAPGKVATVLGAAPVIGAAGTAGIAARDMGLYQLAKGAGYGTEMVKDMLSTPMGKHILREAIKTGLQTGGATFLYKTLKAGGMFSK